MFVLDLVWFLVIVEKLIVYFGGINLFYFKVVILIIYGNKWGLKMLVG